MPGCWDWDMSTPTSARMMAAATGPMPGISSQALGRRGERGQMNLDLFIDRGDIGINAIDPGQQEPVVVIQAVREGLFQAR